MIMTSIISKVKEKQTEYKVNSRRIATLANTITTLQDDLKKEQELVELLDNRIYGCKLLVEKLVAVSKTNLEQFLTFALQKIFTDRNYTIKLDFKEDSKRPGLSFILEENGVEQEITDSVGGGILSTLGLLLQIYYIEVYGLNKTMFIDEGLKEVSKANTYDPDAKDYLTDVLKFLKWLSEERGYTFIIVTHDTSVVESADKVYTIKKGELYE